MENPKKLILRKFAEIQTLSGRKTEFILFAVPEPVGHTRPNEWYLHTRASGTYPPTRAAPAHPSEWGIHTGTERSIRLVLRGKIYRRHEILSV